MRTLWVWSALLLLAFSACESSEGKSDGTETTRSRAEEIIHRSIEFHGGEKYYTSDISFGFRDRMYTVHLSGEGFRYTRAYSDSLGSHLDVLSSRGYIPRISGRQIRLSSRDSAAGAASLNSVVYFALLPRFLTDDAVKSAYTGEEQLSDRNYHRIEVRFSEEGGGEDHQDVYLYWFDTEDYSMDYLAYSFMENEGGSRFRVARNSRRVNGILFQDYDNFKGPSPDSLSYISELYRNGGLTKLSEINLDRLRVSGRD